MEVVFLDAAMDAETGRIAKCIECSECGAVATKENMQLLFETFWDAPRGRMERRPRRVPLFVNYPIPGGPKSKRITKRVDARDIALLRRIESLGLPDRLPVAPLPDCQMTRVGRMRTTNTRSVPHLFLARPAHALSAMWRHAEATRDPRMRSLMLFFTEQAVWGMSTLARYAPTHYSQVNQYLSGVFYVGSQIAEVSPWYILEGKLSRLTAAFRPLPSGAGGAAVATSNCGLLNLSADTIDYIFTDPPFGENIYYSDLNYLVESWHGVLTRSEPEAIMDRVKGKTILDYQKLMTTCFEEYYRVLKPSRWMTVVFHNSKNSVWNAIQESILSAGFVVADVRTLDKKQKTFKQVTSTAVKQDLVISAYKPSQIMADMFRVTAGSQATAWEFVRAHLRQVPVFVSRGRRRRNRSGAAA